MLADVRRDCFAGGIRSLRFGCGQGRWQFRCDTPMQVALIGIGRRSNRLEQQTEALVKLPHGPHRLRAWGRRFGGSHESQPLLKNEPALERDGNRALARRLLAASRP